MRWLLMILGALFAFLSASPASAWGSSGHRIVCEIAFRNLTPTAKAEVVRLLQAHPVIPVAQPLNRELGWACTYPDRTVPGGPTRRAPEHFVNYGRNMQTVTLESGCGLAHECVDNSIITDLMLLRSPFVADRHRAVALMYLGHWVGDIHQPLHNSFADDKGGGDIDASGICSESLHHAWDTCILQRRILNTNADPAISVLQALATTWSTQVTDVEGAKWLSAVPWQWSRESFAITLRPEVKYCVLAQGICRYSTSQDVFGGSNPKTVVIDDAYAAMAVPIVQRRITQAGIRLAHLINLALDPAYRMSM